MGTESNSPEVYHVGLISSLANISWVAHPIAYMQLEVKM